MYLKFFNPTLFLLVELKLNLNSKQHHFRLNHKKMNKSSNIIIFRCKYVSMFKIVSNDIDRNNN